MKRRRKEKQGVKAFSELARPLTSAYVQYNSAAIECGHIPHQVRPLN